MTKVGHWGNLRRLCRSLRSASQENCSCDVSYATPAQVRDVVVLVAENGCSTFWCCSFLFRLWLSQGVTPLRPVIALQPKFAKETEYRYKIRICVIQCESGTTVHSCVWPMPSVSEPAVSLGLSHFDGKGAAGKVRKRGLRLRFFRVMSCEKRKKEGCKWTPKKKEPGRRSF